MPTLLARTPSLAIAAALLAAGAAAGAYAQLPPLPQAVAFPALPATAQAAQGYGQHEFILRDRTVHLRGRLWTTDFDYASAGAGDPRDALGGILRDMQAAGWEVVLRDEPRVPPLATLKHRRDGREVWAQVEVRDRARITWLEPGLPGARLTLPPPMPALVPVAVTHADFPFLPAYPGSRLLGTARDEGIGGFVKEYASPVEATALEIATVYSDALKVAGWDVVEDTTERKPGQDPVIVACWIRDGLELWTRILVRRGSHSIEASTTPLG
jgi:hypothetical protein